MSASEAKAKALEAIILSKENIARGQLHTAIALWFHYGDPVSIHTLAAAAQGVLEGLAGKDHKPPHMKKWMKAFPPRVQRILRDPQNFFKHASKDPKLIKVYQPYIGTMIISDAALLHQDLYGLTTFIRALTIRLSFETEIFAPSELSDKITQGIQISDLGPLDRPAFFPVVFARLNQATVRVR